MISHEPFRLAGIMGYPVQHSRSPGIHNRWLALHGIRGTYVPLEVRPERLIAALRGLPALGFRGCNVTIPHKEAVFAALDSVDPLARRIGAVNCVIVREDGSLHGANTDAFGFMESVRQEAPGWRADAGPAVVLGAGGGARAVVAPLADAGTAEIRLLNRSRPRADRMAEEFGAAVKVYDWAERHEALAGAATVVNCTSLGMAGQPSLDLDLRLLPEAAVAADIVYVPLETPLLREARLRGNRTVNGLGMLLHQARPAFHAWFGIMPEVTPELRGMIEASIG